jgi:hypothetical protein
MPQSNQASIDSLFSFILFSYLWSSRTVVLYFFSYINETHIVLCGSLKNVLLTHSIFYLCVAYFQLNSSVGV